MMFPNFPSLLHLYVPPQNVVIFFQLHLFLLKLSLIFSCTSSAHSSMSPNFPPPSPSPPPSVYPFTFSHTRFSYFLSPLPPFPNSSLFHFPSFSFLLLILLISYSFLSFLHLLRLFCLSLPYFPPRNQSIRRLTLHFFFIILIGLKTNHDLSYFFLRPPFTSSSFSHTFPPFLLPVRPPSLPPSLPWA